METIETSPVIVTAGQNLLASNPNEEDIRNIILSTDELSNRYKDYRANCLVSPIIFQNGINILGAERGSGKTRFAISLGYSICYQGATFLGYEITDYGDVLYLNLEIHEPQFKLFTDPINSHFKDQGLKMQNEFYSISLLSYPKINLKQIEQAIKAKRPVVLIIDSFKAFASRLLLDSKEKELTNLNIGIIYDLLNRWKRNYGVTVLILNHTNKGTKSAKSHSDLMFGPSSLLDYADHTFLLRKTNLPNQRLIVPDKSRFEAEGSVGINLIEIQSNDYKLWFELLQEDVNESDYCYNDSKTSFHSNSDRENVISLHNSNKSIREIESLTSVPKSTIQRWIKKLEQKR